MVFYLDVGERLSTEYFSVEMIHAAILLRLRGPSTGSAFYILVNAIMS